MQTSSSMSVFKREVLSLLDSPRPVSVENLSQLCFGNTTIKLIFLLFFLFFSSLSRRTSLISRPSLIKFSSLSIDHFCPLRFLPFKQTNIQTNKRLANLACRPLHHHFLLPRFLFEDQQSNRESANFPTNPRRKHSPGLQLP